MTPPMNGRSNNIHFESKKYTECRTGSIRDKKVSMTLFLITLASRFFVPLSSAQAPAGHSSKNSNDKKNSNRARDDGKREKSLPSSSARFLLFTLLSRPTTQRGLCEGQRHFTVSQTDIPRL